MKGNLHVFDDVSSLYDALVEHWSTLATAAIAEKDQFHVALAGGNTPKSFYERLAHNIGEDYLPWEKTHIYFGDERCVAQNHSDSNYHMASVALLSRVPIPPSQVHAMFDPAYSAEENASRYETMLRSVLPLDPDNRPMFDLILLGMGDDGHTASLFPGTPILDEEKKTVAAQFVDKLQAWRISLTFPTLNAARQVVMLVAGNGKAQILHEVAQGDDQVPRFPVQCVNPQGNLDWYMDRAAARLLDPQLFMRDS